MKKAAKEVTEEPTSCPDYKQITHVSNIQIELTGNEIVDKKLKDLKKVNLFSFKVPYFCDPAAIMVRNFLDF